MYRTVSQRINHCHLHRNSWAGLRCAGQSALGRSVGCGSFFNLKCSDLSIQFGEKLGFALKTNRNRKFDPLLNVFDTFCIHTDA